MSHRISIVEDDAPTRRMLSEMITETPGLSLLSQYDSPVKAIEGIPAEKPDVVLMDINLPDMSGVECVRILKGLAPETQFLMLTVYEDEDHIFSALTAGATGYLLKSTRRSELLEAIHQILAGGSPMSCGIARKVVKSFAPQGHSPAPPKALSPREHSVLMLLTKGYLYKEIAVALGVSEPTVCTYIRRIYEKLQVRSRSQAVAKYLHQGL